MATITKESIAEAAKLSNMSVNDYIDKLPDNYLQEAAKLSNIDIATYKTKLKEVWGEGLKKRRRYFKRWEWEWSIGKWKVTINFSKSKNDFLFTITQSKSVLFNVHEPVQFP